MCTTVCTTKKSKENPKLSNPSENANKLLIFLSGEPGLRTSDTGRYCYPMEFRSNNNRSVNIGGYCYPVEFRSNNNRSVNSGGYCDPVESRSNNNKSVNTDYSIILPEHILSADKLKRDGVGFANVYKGVNQLVTKIKFLK
ncbi:hypothetical protein C5167_043975 [Papaver somniferum]|uniref:Uncharacterized protein n=1 Tax=Papaver somniferum TaxID=3469 RepID=A0A4Y7LB40_PAPSO|nr:hypothetical protein C5167_043975 [Papaver somniferum]